jgi:hypothetical protein
MYYKGMKNHVKELTEGMQRLCAVANRVVAKQEKVSRIDVDLLLENLRHLYEVALKMECGREEEEKCEKVEESKNQKDEESPSDFRLPTSDLHEGSSSDMAMMLTMAAMQPEGLGADESGKVEEEKRGRVEEEKNEELRIKNEELRIESGLKDSSIQAFKHSSIHKMPSMEELEPNDNALLFDEVIIEPVEEAETQKVEKSKSQKVEETPSDLRPPTSDLQEESPSDLQPPTSDLRPIQPTLLDYLNQPVATVGEQPERRQRTLGESLGADRPGPTSLERKVDDLRTVININDKFSFMSELFHNNMKAYNDFIMSLNAIADRDEALAYVHDMAAQQKWDDASPAVQAFLRVFDKKF